MCVWGMEQGSGGEGAEGRLVSDIELMGQLLTLQSLHGVSI